MGRLQNRETLRAEKGREKKIPGVSAHDENVQFSDEEKEGAEEDFVDQEEPGSTEIRFPGGVSGIGETPEI